jgi:hypothetical protein
MSSPWQSGPSQEYRDREGKPPQEIGIPTLHEGVMQPASAGNADNFEREIAAFSGERMAPADELFEDSDEVKRGRDKHPAAQDVETSMMLFEANYIARKQFRWFGQERWAREYEQERIGKPLHMYEFLRRLEAEGVMLKLNEYGRLGRIGVNALVCSGCSHGENLGCPANCKGRDYSEVLLQSGIYGVVAGPRKRQWKTITTLHNGYGPEFSVMRFDRYNVPTNEKYHGWRTALLVLVKSGIVSKRQAIAAFGEARGNAAQFYLEQVREIEHE